jgi:hypothetical protein
MHILKMDANFKVGVGFQGMASCDADHNACAWNGQMDNCSADQNAMLIRMHVPGSGSYNAGQNIVQSWSWTHHAHLPSPSLQCEWAGLVAAMSSSDQILASFLGNNSCQTWQACGCHCCWCSIRTLAAGSSPIEQRGASSQEKAQPYASGMNMPSAGACITQICASATHSGLQDWAQDVLSCQRLNKDKKAAEARAKKKSGFESNKNFDPKGYMRRSLRNHGSLPTLPFGAETKGHIK